MPRHALERALTYFLTCVLWVSGRLSTGPKEIHTGTNYANLLAMQEVIRVCGAEAQLSLRVELHSRPLESCRSMLQQRLRALRQHDLAESSDSSDSAGARHVEAQR